MTPQMRRRWTCPASPAWRRRRSEPRHDAPNPVAFTAVAHPRHLRRIVLRPGVRIRRDAALAFAGQAPGSRGLIADLAADAGRVVGVDLYPVSYTHLTL